ncbi:hypothetical protein [Clostridium sp.]|uniref:hypothetical protein n=1 Tax=Clostridium sp. TaxID=1506 RepID=UPI00261A092D|nr:hypothetical protein [Clostridium sp.]
MKTCKKCNLPETYNNIIINSDGVCNYCNFYDEHKNELTNFNELEKKFVEKLEQAKIKAKENGARYDCLVGISGGKDSSYIVYQLKNKYNMRVLAFNYDNGFCTEYMDNNVKNLIEKLDVDFIKFTAKDSFLRKNYSMAVGAMKNFCLVCGHYVHYNSFLTAYEKKIPIIINGRTRGQVLQLATSTTMLEPYENPSCLREFEYIMRNMVDEKILKQIEQAMFVDYLDDVRVESLSYFMYHPYNEDSIKDFLEEKIGWERPKDGVKHPDCWAHSLAEHFFLQQNNFPFVTGDIAVSVREGLITREEAMKIMKEEEQEFKNINTEVVERFKKRISIK